MIVEELDNIKLDFLSKTSFQYFIDHLNATLKIDMHPYEVKKIIHDLERDLLNDNSLFIYNAFKTVLTQKLSTELQTKRNLSGLVEEEKEMPVAPDAKDMATSIEALNCAIRILGDQEVHNLVATLGEDESLA